MKSLKYRFLKLLVISLFIIGCNKKTKTTDYKIEEVISKVENQLDYGYGLVESKNDGNLIMPRSVEGDELRMVSSSDWTSGFFPGELWLMYNLTGNEVWKSRAKKYTELLEKEQYNTGTHDVGFMMYCSYGEGYKVTNSSDYKKVLIQTAKSLSSRYNENVKCIKSWDHSPDLYHFPVIIDNMMNMELLLWASEETGDSIYINIAINHANTTIKNHFRPNNSSYHVIDYAPETGKVIKKITNQGYADESIWSRGQSWGLYGFTVMYRYTKDKRYLEQAEKIAKCIMSYPNLPDDKIPYWDMDAPNIPKEPRDASAAAITASALYELINYTSDKDAYLEFANGIMKSLSSSSYLNTVGADNGFILSHSTGNMPRNSEIDVPINYADYYFLEALLRKKK
ncbi:glycoside hydrolase family 88 protein [Flavivirga amylovorans]|uniref:Glycoside hydrolase family 88 protein n=1 Tax=Flavivirga amylovorans TaxID=870486 RepID=A0ABT8WZ00_9FLAO|nr:glycoside hydrolase family 88 protein [Flavivirga amylovorans]MDO5986575.1 glycoside hydrolase family 88 protein [Flavivirga amylovorans]